MLSRKHKVMLLPDSRASGGSNAHLVTLAEVAAAEPPSLSHSGVCFASSARLGELNSPHGFVIHGVLHSLKVCLATVGMASARYWRLMLRGRWVAALCIPSSGTAGQML